MAEHINRLLIENREVDGRVGIGVVVPGIGVGLASVVNTFDPACVYVGGEITRAWDLIEPTVRMAIAERALTAAAAATPIRPVSATEYSRLRGAAALVAAPAYAVRGSHRGSCDDAHTRSNDPDRKCKNRSMGD